MDNVMNRTLTEVADALQQRTLTATAVTDLTLARIEATDVAVGAFASVQDQAARSVAQGLDDGDLLGPLHGVPIAIKDIIYTKDVATEANCAALEGFVPDHDATVVRRLREAGAIIVGKTNTHELATGVSCPASKNPWDIQHMTGGSSGGNAAALAARQIFGSIGSDTGGSVRIPSSYCGTTGLKTTRGAVPRDGVHLLSWTYDTIGPMARTAADCRVLLDVIAGHAVEDPYSSRTPFAVAQEPAKLTIGFPDESFYEGIETDPQILTTLDAAIEVLRTIVADVCPVAVVHPQEHAAAGATIVACETAVLLSELHATKGHLIGAEPSEPLLAGMNMTATDLVAAQRQRMNIERAYLDVFDEQGVDIIVMPVTPTHVPTHGATHNGDMPLIAASTPFAFPINGAGLPALALPGQFGDDGLPIGFQLIGRPRSEHTLTDLGEAFQAVTDFHQRVPTL